jgi:sterol desaturase/sphingolipid hydroxylase (fatty acid hydroxylase superfamily)
MDNNLLAIGILSIILSLGLTSFALLHCWFVEVFTDYLYIRLGWLKRQNPLGKLNAERRQIVVNFIDFFLSGLPGTTAIATILYEKWIHSTLFTTEFLEFSLAKIYCSLLILYVIFDAWFFHIHFMEHKFSSIYKSCHKKHHEHIVMTVWSNGYGNYLENIVGLAPPSLLFIITLSYLEWVNIWNLLLPSISLVMNLNCNHMGYANHWSLLFTSPLE